MSALPAVLLSLVPTPVSARATPPVPVQVTPTVIGPSCAESIRDQANPLTCIEASRVPELGKIFPLSENLFVSTSGNVGIGTTNPTKKLEVAGDVRVAGTLTLSPSGTFTALDVAAGSIFKGGLLFIHTNGGTAVGIGALQSDTGYGNNVAFGANALHDNTSGQSNVAVGSRSLEKNVSGGANTAIGSFALASNLDGSSNTAVGRDALKAAVSSSSNTAIGQGALSGANVGSRNIAVGRFAGDLVTGNDNIAIGNRGTPGEDGGIRIGTAGVHTSTFLAGVRGVTTANANAIPVLVDSAGQLGTVSSSRRFKEEIEDMCDRTERLLALRPVVFRFKPDVQAGERPLEYGLIAEEVAEVFPELVVNDGSGKPFTVKYHLLSAMLLNELEKLHAEVSVQRAEDGREAEELRSAQARLDALEVRLAALESEPRSNGAPR